MTVAPTSSSSPLAHRDSFEINRRNWDERALIHARDLYDDYRLDAFRGGEDTLFPIEMREIGDLRGKRVLHLECHIGCDTLSLARRGAHATGLDFSPVALGVAGSRVGDRP
jgi:2-polyprenyl-3-methyl-5-hydroxy-6-metoxy-1,4-benzoquinol methylase